MVQFDYKHYINPNLGADIASVVKAEFYKSPLKLEGGNILIDDEGRLFLTEKVVEDNVSIDRRSIEEELKRSLFVKSVQWMPKLPNERTGHIDMYSLYAGKNRMIVSDSLNPKRKSTLDDVAAIYSSLGFEVIRIENAEESYDNATTYSYTNALIVGETVFVPAYERKKYSSYEEEENERKKIHDAEARDKFVQLGFKVVSVPASTLIYNGGAVHCLSGIIPFTFPEITPRTDSSSSINTDK